MRQWGKWKNTGSSQQDAARAVQVLLEYVLPLGPENSSQQTSRSRWAASLIPLLSFLVSFLFLTTTTFPRCLITLWLCLEGSGNRRNLTLSAPTHTRTHTRTRHSAFKDRLVSLKHFLATSLWKSDFSNQRRLKLLCCFFRFCLNNLAFPTYCSLENSNQLLWYFLDL